MFNVVVERLGKLENAKVSATWHTVWHINKDYPLECHQPSVLMQTESEVAV